MNQQHDVTSSATTGALCPCCGQRSCACLFTERKHCMAYQKFVNHGQDSGAACPRCGQKPCACYVADRSNSAPMQYCPRCSQRPCACPFANRELNSCTRPCPCAVSYPQPFEPEEQTAVTGYYDVDSCHCPAYTDCKACKCCPCRCGDMQHAAMR